MDKDTHRKLIATVAIVGAGSVLLTAQLYSPSFKTQAIKMITSM